MPITPAVDRPECRPALGMSGTQAMPAARSVPLSVFVITKNEAGRLARTLEALAWVRQIVVVDSGSSDETCAIARGLGADVHHRAWDGYGPQKVFAESLCHHRWLMNVDADEVVTPALGAEIARMFANGEPAPAACRLRILNVYPGDLRPRPLAADYSVVRLYHRDIGRYRDHPLFDRVVLVPGASVRVLRGPIWHFPLLDWAHMVEKENRYTSFQADRVTARARWPLRIRLWTEMPFAFLKFYLIRRHVTGGWKGVAFSGIAAFARWLRIVKLLARTGGGTRGSGESDG